ncbi:MAG: TonB-dependent receptor [Gemmatimonadales bacterium]|nr:TonB-dependent receptor [Gemmatimonadales bacterium]
MRVPGGALLLLPALVFLGRPAPVGASLTCTAASDSAAAGTDASGSPLLRLVSFHSREISLRDALDRIAASARVRLSYSAEALPLDRRLCLAFDGTTVGGALAALFAGSAIRFVAVGADHIVLAPAPADAKLAERPPVILDRIVVTGRADGATQRALPIALDILDGRDLAGRLTVTMSQALNSAVPGLWMWEQSPVSVLAKYGSIRGASSFGMSYPKVYIDGIQVANPLLLTRLMPESIERIEVIRGPQGAALYGADAISGVTNIVSRHDAAEDGPRAKMSAGLGLASSAYSAGGAVQQDYGFSLRAGSNTRSVGLTVAAGALGAYVPSAYSRHLSVVGVGKRVGAKSILTGTARFFGLRTGTARSPLLSTVVPPGGMMPIAGTQSMSEYTLGMTAKFFPGDRWQHTLVAGLDGYALDGVPDDRSPIPSAAAVALNDARGSAARATLRASSVLRLKTGTREAADLTLSAEQSFLRERAAEDQVPPRKPGGPPPPPRPPLAGADVVRWRGNTGLTAQVNAAWREQLFLVGGVRVERDEGSAGVGRFATLPMVGVAWARELDGVSFKLRGAYGKGIRWPETPVRETLWEGARPGGMAPSLAPEEQSGLEGGVDLAVGNVLSLQVTRFDQVASGLIQRVTVLGDTAGAPGPNARPLRFQLQNVGEIRNRGWEAQAGVRRGPVALAVSWSRVDSRVRRVAANYSGELMPGDRMLEVPSSTVGVTASYAGRGWLGALTAYRAMDWINYDRVALAHAFAGPNRPPRDFVGRNLRAFWREYPGVTHLKASGAFQLRRRFEVTLSADNLLNRQTGEPDNITVLPGRTMSFGLRTSF